MADLLNGDTTGDTGNFLRPGASDQANEDRVHRNNQRGVESEARCRLSKCVLEALYR